MRGVVIWTAMEENKAIIWCEDHGDLAYIGQAQHRAASAERFDEGDLIQFDITVLDNLRLAENPRKIADNFCNDLKSVAKTAGEIKDLVQSDSKVTCLETVALAHSETVQSGTVQAGTGPANVGRSAAGQADNVVQLKDYTKKKQLDHRVLQ